MDGGSPELLSPAGTLKNLRYALAYGADAVYAGVPRYSLRVRNNDFRGPEQVGEGVRLAHAAGRKFLLAVNALPHGAKLRTFIADMEPLIEQGPDALIMADPGLIHLTRQRWPEQAIHLSVQANTMNAEAVRFWQSVGVERVILSRELSLDQIEEIRQACPDVELEVFVHGALCIAHSGRCLLSGYFNHRDANQGTCTNACRWEYKVSGGSDESHGRPEIFLEEKQRPGEFMPVEEDEHGTYIMNSKDLRAVQHVSRLAAMGIDCLKIEGRTKSHYYTARATAAYRKAIDDARAGRDLDPALIADLDGLASRGYTDGFFERHTPEETQNYLDGASRPDKEHFVGEIESVDEAGIWVQVKNKFAVSDQLRLVTPQGGLDFELRELTGERGQAMEVAPGAGYRVRMPLPEQSGCVDEFALLTRYL